MTLETTAIQHFLDLVKRAAQVRSRDVRVEMSDATILASEIAVLLARLASLEHSLGRTQTTAMDGGSLR